MALEDMEIEYVSQRVGYWLRKLTGPQPWTEPMAYTPPEGILEGELGAYKGVRVVELTLAESVKQHPAYRWDAGWD